MTNENESRVGGIDEGVLANLDNIDVPMYNLPQYGDRDKYEAYVKVMLHRYVRDEDDVKVKLTKKGKGFEWEITADCRDPERIMGYLTRFNDELTTYFEPPEPEVIPDEEVKPPDDTSGAGTRKKTSRK